MTTRAALAAAAQALEDSGALGALGGGVPPLAPTWAALRDYFEFVFASSGFQLSDDALRLLQGSSFAELTGCPAFCTYAPQAFPSPNFTTPVVTVRGGGGRAADGGCPPAPEGTLPTLPDDIDPSSRGCDADWSEALVSGAGEG